MNEIRRSIVVVKIQGSRLRKQPVRIVGPALGDVAAIVAAAIVFGLQFFYGSLMSPLVRLTVGVVLLSGAYLAMLLQVMGQKVFYLNLIKGIRSGSPIEEQISVPV